MGFSVTAFLAKAPDPLHIAPDGAGGLDPGGLFLPPSFPDLPALPQMPSINPGFMGPRTTKTNYGTVNVPSMQDKLNQAQHPAIKGYVPPAPKPPTTTKVPPGIGTSGPPNPGGGGEGTGTGGTYRGPPPGGSNPVNPSPPGTIGIGGTGTPPVIPTLPVTTVTLSMPVAPADSGTASEMTQQGAMDKLSNRLAQTPNTVLTRSAMTVPTQPARAVSTATGGMVSRGGLGVSR
jgi:hypothetical protein